MEPGLPNFRDYCEQACVALWGEPDRKTARELRWNGGDAYSAKTFNRRKRAWFDHGAQRGGSTLELVAYAKGQPKIEPLRGAAFFDTWRMAHEMGIVPEPPPEKRNSGTRTILATYPYYDETGELIFEVVRYDTAAADDRFRQRRPDGAGGWIWKVKGVVRTSILYRLPQLLEAVKAGQRILVTEGEKDANTAVALGFAATSPPGGASVKWLDEYDQFFCGADVVIVSDNDPQTTDPKTGEPGFHDDGRAVLPGQDHAVDVARHLRQVAAHVRTIIFPQKDLTAWREAGGTRAALEALIDTAPDQSRPLDPAEDPDIDYLPEPESAPGRNGPDAREPKPQSNAGGQPIRYGRIDVYNAGHLDIASIPPRGWLLGVTFCRKFISGLIAEGALGKTAIRYTQFLAVATCRELTGERVHVRSRVLIACLEDDLDEVRRRIGAAMLRHGVKQEEIDGWLFYCTPRGLKLLKTDPRLGLVVGELYTELKHIIERLSIDIVGIDPFIKAHGVGENDNTAIDQVCIMLAELADEANCAIDLVSHARKGLGMPGDAERERGASAKKDAGRLMRTVTGMTPEEAALFNVAEHERPSLIRVDDAKINLAPRSAEAAWFKLIGVPLGNTFDLLYPNGDKVQTVERWRAPDLFANLDTRTANAILNKIEAGPYEGGRYSPAPNAKERAAGPVIQEFCSTFSEKQARHVLNTWIKKGVLVVRDHEDPKHRKVRPGLFVEKRPGDTWNS